MAGETDWGIELRGTVADGHVEAFGARAMHLNGGQGPSRMVPVCPTCGRASWRPCLMQPGPEGDRYLAAVHRACVLRMARRENVPDRTQLVTMWGGIHPEAACTACESAVMDLVGYAFHVAACQTGDRRRVP